MVSGTEDFLHFIGLIDVFCLLMIFPVMYDILYSAVSYRKPKPVLLLNYLPTFIVSILIGVMCYISDFNNQSYLYNINKLVFNITIGLQVLCFSVVMCKNFYNYRQKIFYYYVDVKDTDYKYVRNVCTCFMLIIIMVYFQIIFKRQTLYEETVIIIIYLMSTIVILACIGYNLHLITGKTIIKQISTTEYSAEEVLQMAKQAINAINPDKSEKQDVEILSTFDNYESKVIETLMNQWITRADKPYLREGITLNNAADDMGISSRTLSLYINNVTKQNFNNWINSLRINEAKHLIENDINMPILNVAIKCGFADTAMLSKNFKRFVGCTPTAFKQQLKERRAEV